MGKLRTLMMTQRILPPVPKEGTQHTTVCAGSHSVPKTFRTHRFLFLTPLSPLTTTMPAIRTTKKKSTKSASGPYAKSEQGVKTEKGTKVDPSNGTYDRVQMFSDIVRVSFCLTGYKLTSRERSQTGPSSRRASIRALAVS